MNSPSEELTWHSGATVEGIPAPASKAAKPAAGAGEPIDCAVLSIPQLTAQKATCGDLEHFKARVLALREQDSRTLIARIATTSDGLMLWSIHLTLDKRGIAPALRWPANTDSPQNEFIAFAADLHWFTKRNPGHKTGFRSWASLLRHPPASPAWHIVAHRLYLFVAARHSLAHWCSRGLALSEQQRLELMMLPTNAMQAERRPLQPERLEELRAQLLTHAMVNRDKSGAHQPHEVANRRAAIWRTHLLSGKCQATTARNWQLLTGHPLTRQALAKQIAIAEDVARGRP